MADKVYIGSGWTRFFQDGGKVIGFRLFREDVAKLNANLDEEGGINIDICERVKPSDKGQTHYGKLNTYKPKGKQQGEQPVKPLTNNAPDRSSDSEQERMPF